MGNKTKTKSGRKGKLILALTAAVGGSVLPIHAAFSASSGNWGTDSGTVFTTADVINGLNANDAVTNYAVYANSMVNSIHVEGNVKVGSYTAKSVEPLNQIGAVLSRNQIKGMHVYQTINTPAEEDTDFTVGAYDSDGSLIDTVKVTVPAGQKTGNTHITSETNPAIFEALTSGTVTFSNGDNGAVSYSVSPVTNSSYYTNEIGTMAAESSLQPQYFDASSIGAVTYIEDMQNAGFNGTDFTFDSGTTVTVSNYKSTDSDAARIVQKGGIKAETAATLNQLSGFSVSLADAKAGYNNGELSVINLKSTTGDLTSDLQALGYNEIQNGKGISDVINNDGLLLINIDTDGRDIYYLDQINIDGSNADSNNETLARHVIYNFIDSSSGSFQPYTGEITINNVAAGTVLAPKAAFVHNGGMRGEIIADSYDHTGGSELHKDTLTIGGTVRTVVSDTVKTPAEPTEKPTAEPSEEPTAEPTEEPTEEPTAEPTTEPTAEPTKEPTAEPIEKTTAVTFHAVKRFMPRKALFRYTLKDSEDTEIESVSSDTENGKIEFQPITYTEEDAGKTYTYTLTEDKGNSDQYDYDSNVYTIEVKVNKDESGNLATDTTVTDSEGKKHGADEMVFDVTNPDPTTEPPEEPIVEPKPTTEPTAEPSEKPAAPDAGNTTTTVTFHAVKRFMPRKKAFKYTLKDSNGIKIESVSSDTENGDIEFTPLTYSSEDVGKTYTYTLTEDKGDSDQYDYDSTVYTIKVTVNEDKTGNLTTDTTVTDGNGEEHSSGSMIFNVTSPGDDTEPSAEPSEEPTAKPSEEPSAQPSEKTDDSSNSKSDSKSDSKTTTIVVHDQSNNSTGGTSTGSGSITTVKKTGKSPNTGVEAGIGKLALVMAGAAVVLVIARKASKR